MSLGRTTGYVRGVANDAYEVVMTLRNESFDTVPGAAGDPRAAGS